MTRLPAMGYDPLPQTGLKFGNRTGAGKVEVAW